MKFFIGFDTIEEAIALLNKAGAASDDDTGPAAAPGAVDPRLGVELDSKGFPWVAEVHAGTKGKNQDGTWKQKKGVTAEARVAAEQSALAHLQSTAGPATPTTVAVQTPVVMPDPAAVAPGLAMGGMPGGLPAIPVAATLPPVSYEQLTEMYGSLAGQGLIDAARMVAIYAECQVNPAELGTNETARSKVYAKLQSLVPSVNAMPGM
jgi:hypothetical protein